MPLLGDEVVADKAELLQVSKKRFGEVDLYRTISGLVLLSSQLVCRYYPKSHEISS